MHIKCLATGLVLCAQSLYDTFANVVLKVFLMKLNTSQHLRVKLQHIVLSRILRLLLLKATI